MAKGQQAYLVYPVIEGAKDDQPELDFPHDPPAEEPAAAKKSTRPSAKTAAKKAAKAPKQAELPSMKQELRSATAMYEELRHGALAGLRLGLLTWPPERGR